MARTRTCLCLTLLALAGLTPVGISVASVPQVPQLTPGAGFVRFSDFKSLKFHILDLISTSRKRVIVISDFLTDGDISSALYLAKYRKVKVNVLLGKRKANSYLSRVRYLKRQEIIVSHRPRGLPLTDPTIILVDDRLYRISRDLNVLRPEIAGTITQVHPRGITVFLDALLEAFKNRKGFKIEPFPKVGRPSHRNVSRRYRKPYRPRRDGSYDYDRQAPRSKPDNVPTRLPKSTLYQKNKRLKEQKRLEKLQTEDQKPSMINMPNDQLPEEQHDQL